DLPQHPDGAIDATRRALVTKRRPDRRQRLAEHGLHEEKRLFGRRERAELGRANERGVSQLLEQTELEKERVARASLPAELERSPLSAARTIANEPHDRGRAFAEHAFEKKARMARNPSARLGGGHGRNQPE